jgi:anti-anti-sigma factor
MILELSGSLNVNSAEAFRSIAERLTAKESFMISLEKLTTVTSSGLETLIEVSIEAKNSGKRIIYLWPDEELLEIVDTLDYNEYLIFAKSVEEGITKLKFFTG